MSNMIVRLLILVTTIFALPAFAESKTARAVIPWDGEGMIYQISADELLFLGELKGIIYVQTGKGAFDEGFVSCPLSQKIHADSGASSVTGYCTIVISPENSIFAEWSCKGKTGHCEGTMDFTGGLGKFKKIKGKSKVLIRSPLQSLVTDLSSGSAVRAGSGIMVLTDIVYKH